MESLQDKDLRTRSINGTKYNWIPQDWWEMLDMGEKEGTIELVEDEGGEKKVLITVDDDTER